MGFGPRIFNKKQSMEREVKDLYLKFTSAATASAELATSEPIIFTSVAKGAARNSTTITLEVEAAAANPTDTVLVDITGTAAAIIITVTPNDGTNNAATPVDLTTEELVELINSGAVVGKTITLTDDDSLRALQTAAGGDTTPLAEAGEGDGEVATFANGVAPVIVEGIGIESVDINAAGDYTIVLQDKYYDLKYCRAMVMNSTAVDVRFQLHSEAVDTTSSVRLLMLTGATKTDLPDSTTVLVKFENKNAGGF